MNAVVQEARIGLYKLVGVTLNVLLVRIETHFVSDSPTHITVYPISCYLYNIFFICPFWGGKLSFSPGYP